MIGNEVSPIPPEVPNYPDFRYVDRSKLRVIHSIEVDADTYVETVGQTDQGEYEWLIRKGAEIISHSNDGYGISFAALRDGLMAYLPKNS